MAETVTALYRLKFKDLASKGMLRVAGVTRGMTRALKTASVGMGAIGLAAGVASLKLANAFADRGDEIAKFSRQVDISAESLQRLEFVANRQGASFQNVKSGIEKFTKSMGEFRGGTGSLKTVLEKVDPVLGKQLLAIKGNSQAFNFAVKSLSKYKDAQQQAAVAAALFGRSGGAAYIRIVDGGAEAFAKLNAEAERFRPPIPASDLAKAEAYKDSIFNTTQVIKSLGDSVGARLLPIMTELADRFNAFVVANREFINAKVSSAFDRIADAAKRIDFGAIATKVRNFAFATGELMGKIGALVQRMGGAETVVKGLIAVFAIGKILGFVSALAPLVAILGGPVTLAIMAVVGIGVLLWKNWDKIKAKALEMGINLDEVFAFIAKAAKFAIGKVLNNIKNAVAGFKLIVKAAGIMRAKMAEIWTGIKNVIAGGVNFYIDKINKLLGMYNKIAGSALGRKLGLAEAGLVNQINVSQPARDSAAARTPANDQRIIVDLRGEVKGADVAANVTAAGTRSTGGYNMPGGRMSLVR